MSSPSPASASADGCDNFSNPPYACVQVQGSGTFVDWARGGVGLAARQDTRGHFEIWGHGFRHMTEDVTLTNDQFRGRTVWGPRHQLNRDFPAGTKICARFHERKADGSYGPKGPACVEIQR